MRVKTRICNIGSDRCDIDPHFQFHRSVRLPSQVFNPWCIIDLAIEC